MIKFIKLFIWIVFFIFVNYPKYSIAAEQYILSFKNLNLLDDEKITSFTIEFLYGKINSYYIIPLGWKIELDNHESWNTKMTGNAGVGAASLHEVDFHNFVKIEKSRFSKVPIDIKAELTTTIDFSKENKITINKNNIELTEIKKE